MVIYVAAGGNTRFFGSALTRPIPNYKGNLLNSDQISVQPLPGDSPYLTPVHRPPGTEYFKPFIKPYQPPTTENMGFTIPVGPLPYHSKETYPAKHTIEPPAYRVQAYGNNSPLTTPRPGVLYPEKRLQASSITDRPQSTYHLNKVFNIPAGPWQNAKPIEPSPIKVPNSNVNPWPAPGSDSTP